MKKKHLGLPNVIINSYVKQPTCGIFFEDSRAEIIHKARQLHRVSMRHWLVEDIQKLSQILAYHFPVDVMPVCNGEKNRD